MPCRIITATFPTRPWRRQPTCWACHPLELDELATFYTFIYREPVGKYVIHVCDSLICWMENGENLAAHLCDRLGVRMGETSGRRAVHPAAGVLHRLLRPGPGHPGQPHGARPLTIESLDG
jgi:hypothetical protein